MPRELTSSASGAPSTPDEPIGLTSTEAARRLAEAGPNELPTPAPPTLLVRVARQLAEPLSLLLIGAALISAFALGHLVEGAAIAAIVALNVGIGTAQEGRANAALATLVQLTAPTSRVRRDGQTSVNPARELVPGDVIELAAGDRVPADVELVAASSVAIDEALLTGESEPAEKSIGSVYDRKRSDGERACTAFAGTLVVRGRAVGIVRRTGTRTEMGAIAAGSAAPPSRPSWPSSVP